MIGPGTRLYPRGFAAFAAAIFLSGFAALTYQVVWQRVLTQVIGSDALSAVVVVAIFMVWLGLGAELGRVFARDTRARAAYRYAGIELVIAVYGALSIPLLRAGNAAIGQASNVLGVDLAANALLLCLPVLAIGMTTPLVVHVARRELVNLGRTVGTLYGLNILGAAAGALASGLVLIELVGLNNASGIAALCNAAAGFIAIVAARRMRAADDDAGSEPRPASASRTVRDAPRDLRLQAAAIFFGFGTLSLQIVFFRILGNYLTLVPAVFPIVLFAFLLLMALGQALGGWAADMLPRHWRTLILGLAATGALLLALAMRLPSEVAAAFEALRFTTFNGALVPEYGHLVGDPRLVVALCFCTLFMLAVLPWAAIFPVLMRIFTEDCNRAGREFGRLYMLYTAGNVAGVLLSGIALLSAIGTEGTAAITAGVVLAGALLLIRLPAASPRYAPAVAVLTIGGICAIAAIPRDYYRSFALGAYRIGAVYEDANGVVTVVPTKSFYSIVDFNRTAAASALTRNPGSDDQYEAWRWNHTELMALDPAFRPKRVLVIGLGHAYLIDALLDHDFVEKIVVVELVQGIVQAVRAHTMTGTRRVFTDPRVEIVLADGRRYLQSAIKQGIEFDLIQIKINEPWHAGAGNLFTVEFLATVKQALSAGGYLGVRPLVGHLSDGLKVFPAAIYPGYYHVFFRNGPMAMPEVAHVGSDIAAQWRRRLPGSCEADSSRQPLLQVSFFDKLPAELGRDVNSDDRPTFEYYWLRQWLGRWVSPRESLAHEKFAPYRRTVPVTGASAAKAQPCARPGVQVERATG